MDTIRFTELQDAYADVQTETERIDNLIEQAVEVRNYDVERAQTLADEILRRSAAGGYTLGKGRGLNLKGWCYWRIGEYEEAREVLNKAYTIARDIRAKDLEARVLNNFAAVYRDLGDLVRSLNYLDKALQLNEESGDERAQAVLLASIASIYYDLSDYDSALEFALRALPVFEEAGDTHRLGNLHYILGNIYFKQGAFSQALQHFQGNLALSEPSTIAHALAMSGLGKVYFKMGVTGPAEEYLSNALKVGEELGDVEVPITCFYYQGCIEMQEGSYRRAAAQFKKAMDMAESSQRRSDMMSLHETYASLYELMGNLPQAYHHLKSFEQLKEEIFRQTAFNKLRSLQMRQELELAHKELEVAEKTALLKQQFMANMSHEIRTPMNAIVGMTRLLLEKNPLPNQQKYLRAIQQSADNLLVIINDILDFSKLEAGKIALEKIPFSVADVLTGVRDTLLLKAEEKELNFWLEIDARIPEALTGDPTRLTQILLNLAGNAVKFTEKGFVALRAVLMTEEEKHCRIRFEVEDSGVGISDEYASLIFESFTQAGSDTARKFGGTGLGLTISKQLVELMEGTLSLKSEQGAGTTFFLEMDFPCSAETAATTKEEQPLYLPERLSHARILLVEDNEFNRMVAEDTLLDMLPGAQLSYAENGQEAVDALREKAFDFVLMDIQMAVMDGVQATRIIRRELPQPACSTPIIAMTANVLREDVDKYLSVGMNAYVPKPFRVEDLKKALLLAAPAEKKMPEAVAEKSSSPPLLETVTDLNFLQTFSNGAPEKVAKYIHMFLQNAPRLLAEIETGIKAGRAEDVKIAAHSLKPQLGYMGVKEAVSKVLLLEQSAAGAGSVDSLQPLFENVRRVCEKAFVELREQVA